MKLRALLCRLTLVASVVSPVACTPSKPAGSALTATAPHAGSIFFWHATQKGKPGSVWLLGSIHVRDGKSASLDRAVTETATACERGAFELDLDAVDPSEAAEYIGREGTLTGKTLRDVVKPETYAAWVKAMDANKFPKEPQEKLKPWVASLLMQVQSMEKRGIKGDNGVDKLLYYFEKQEPTRKRTVVGLETMAEQLTLLQSTSPEIQDLMLRAAAEEAGKSDIDELVAAYAAGDEAGIEAQLTSGRAKEPELEPFMEAVFDKRNVTMTEKIKPMFDTAGCTVVTVGVGHMLGPSGIVHRLEAQGYAVERVAGLGPTAAAKMAYTEKAATVFGGPKQGFEVTSRVAPMQQDMPPSKAGTTGGHVYSFAEKAAYAQVVSTVAMTTVPTASQRMDALKAMAIGGLQNAKLVAGDPEEITFAGEPAVRLRGDHGTGGMPAAQSITLFHGSTLFVLMSVQMDESAETRAQADAAFDALLKTFRFR